MTNSSGPTRVLFLHPSDELYGADRMLLAQVDALGDPTGAEVWLPRDVDYPEHQLCRVLRRRGVMTRHVDLPVLRRAYRSPQALLALLARTVRMVRLLRRARPDVVYCTTSAGLLAAPAARLARVPVVIGHVQEMWGATERRLLTGPALACHALVAISDFVAAQLPARVRARTSTVPNGTPEPLRESVADSEQTTDEPLTFAIASRWNGWKGHRTLLAAWASVPGSRLLVFGGPPHSGARVDVPALVRALPDPSSVAVVGEVPDAADRLAAADVVIVPSDQPEPFGLVAIEAFARGRPVVASNAGGLADIVSHGRNGWLFEPGDVRGLSELLRSLDRPAVRAAGEQAQLTYRERYTLARYEQDWRAVLDAALSRSRAR